MYAIIADSGTQYCVEEGQRLLVDLRDAEAGAKIEFDKVLLVGGEESGAVIGKPTVAGAKVVAEVLGHPRGEKIKVLVYKRRKNFRKHRGHRQTMTEVKIEKIITG